jgi:hypothetical protein
VAHTLLACPFCRELYKVVEAEICPVCGVRLEGLEALPPSYEVREQLAREWEQTAHEDRPLPWHNWGHGKGLLALTSLLGLSLFFGPWIELTQPNLESLSGFDLASTRGFWFGGGAAAWFVNLPLVLSRRTLNQMRGVRIVCTLLSGLTACQTLLLVVLAPESELIPVQYTWGWAFWGSAVVSVVAALLAPSFGAAPREQRTATRSREADARLH